MEERKILESWKDIASYLKRSMATCQRWEIELGLPVHRLDGTPRARVFAYADEIDRWMAEKLRSAEVELEASEELRRRRSKRVVAAAGAVIIVAAMAVLAWLLFFQKSISPLPIKKPTLAILHFENLSGSEDLDWLRIGLPELITTDLFQSKYLDVLGRDDVYRILKELNLLEAKRYSTEDLIRVAGKANVDRLGFGSFTKAGENFIITFNLQNARGGELINSRKVACRGEAWIPGGIDELARQIKSDLNLEPKQIAQDIDMDLGSITSSSPEALKYYVEGLKLKLRQDRDLAKSFFEKAVAVDPEFAMAYKALALCLDTKEDRTKILTRALEFGDRISTRERYAIRANYYSAEKNYEKAIEVNKKLLELYPDDNLANAELARIYLAIQDLDNAIKYREFLYGKNKTSRSYTLQLVSLYNDKGSYDKAIPVYKYYLDNVSEDYDMRLRLYEAYWRSGKYELALEEADRIEAINPDKKDREYMIFLYYLMGNYAAAEEQCEMFLQKRQGRSVWGARDWLQNIYITQGQFGKARQQLILGLQEEEELGSKANDSGRFVLRKRLSGIYLIEGNLENALNEAEKALKVSVDSQNRMYQIKALTTKAEIYLEMKLFDKAQKTAEEIHDLIKKSDLEIKNFAGKVFLRRNEMIPYYFISGKIELKKGNLTKAINYLEKAQSLEVDSFSTPSDFIVALASAYYQAGKLQSAQKEYEKIPLLTLGRLLEGYTYATSFYMLAKICEQQGDRTKAIGNYGKFLDLWKDADRVLPEVEDARTRLARLVSE